MSEIIASVSGVRGILGDSLTPENIIKFTSAFAKFCREKSNKNKIVVGSDGRMFGDVITGFVIDTLVLSGFEVTYIGVAPTPTIQIATAELKASGGISVTASHNPQQWNGLKFLNSGGTFLNEDEMNEIIRIANEDKFIYSGIDNLIQIKGDSSWIDKHIKKVLKLKILNLNKIKKRKFKVVVDAVNSSGSVIVPKLLEKLRCKVIKLFCDGSGKFPHIPEP
ncbi:MAG: phosphoglucosamine mutase, partial [bacterium]